jgi:hypothetical protein
MELQAILDEVVSNNQAVRSRLEEVESESGVCLAVGVATTIEVYVHSTARTEKDASVNKRVGT